MGFGWVEDFGICRGFGVGNGFNYTMVVVSNNGMLSFLARIVQLFIHCVVFAPLSILDDPSSDDHGFHLIYLYCRSVGCVGLR